MFKWAYDGVNLTVPRTAGLECREYLGIFRILTECVIVTFCSVYLVRWSWRNIKRKKLNLRPLNDNLLWGKQVLLVAMAFTFGIEMGFKLASRSVIYILNPCHVTTLIQIYLLAARPNASETITFWFRIQMNFLNGPLLAFMFPETDSRQFTFEAVTYWIQHALMCIIPVYLLRLGGNYTMEPLHEFDWNCLGYSVLLIYHFTFLQIMSLPSHVNLNHMLCPAIKDPFDGPNYRLAAIVHQGILCPFLSKLVTLVFTPRSSNPQLLDPQTIHHHDHPSGDNFAIKTDESNNQKDTKESKME